MARFKKGSIQAKRYMASIRRKKKGSHVTTRKRKINKLHTYRKSMVAKRKVRRTTRKSNLTSGAEKDLIGSGLVVLYDAFISPMIPLGNPIAKTGIEAVAGIYLARRKGILGKGGQALAVISSYKLINALMHGNGSMSSTAGGSAY